MPLEERRYKEMAEQQFGEKEGRQTKICSDIKSRTGVFSYKNVGSLHICIMHNLPIMQVETIECYLF